MIDEIRWKFVAATAIIAMVVSLLSGGLGGIRLGTLLLRATMGGAVFAVLALGLNLLILRLFPEILDSVHTAGNDSIPGSRVDIMMGDDVDGALSRPSVETVSESADDVTVEGPSTAAKENDGTLGENKDDAGEEGEGEEDGDEAAGDLDHFSDAFGDIEEASSGASPPISEVLDGDDHNPEEIAQAIHTVMKRDEKG